MAEFSILGYIIFKKLFFPFKSKGRNLIRGCGFKKYQKKKSSFALFQTTQVPSPDSAHMRAELLNDGIPTDTDKEQETIVNLCTVEHTSWQN